jgi:riboflavin transporter FmnP
MKTYTLVSCALLAGAAIALQLSNSVLGIPTGFGMTVDLVGVPVLLALFLFGFEAALLVLAAACFGIVLVSPTGVVGALAKFLATLPMLLIPAAALFWKKRRDAAVAFAVVGIFVAVLAYSFAGFARMFSQRGADVILGAVLPVAALLACAWAVYEVSKRAKIPHDAALLSAPALALCALAVAALVRGALMTVANYYIAGPLYFGMMPDQFAELVQKANVLFLGSGTAWYAAIFFWNAVQAALEFSLAWLLAYRFGLSKYSK